MTKIYGRSTAATMIASALGMRLFAGLAVEHPVALNASWLCPLLGLLIYLPLAFAVRQAEKLGNGSAWDNLCNALPSPLAAALSVTFALALLYDAAANIRLTASSSNIIALGDVSVYLLIVPLGVVTCMAVWLGGDALGDSARIALRVLPLFVVIVLLVQLPKYRFGWLTPVFGSGAANILSGSIYCAGCMALMTLPWLMALPDRRQRGLLGSVVLPSLGVSALMVMQHMSAPVMPWVEFTRAARIELVLSNGRLTLYPQFVLNLLWYGGLLYLLAAEVVAASAFLKRTFPFLKMWMLALQIALAVSFAAVFNPAWIQKSGAVLNCMFMALGALIALPMLCALAGRRGEEKCAERD